MTKFNLETLTLVLLFILGTQIWALLHRVTDDRLLCIQEVVETWIAMSCDFPQSFNTEEKIEFTVNTSGWENFTRIK